MKKMSWMVHKPFSRVVYCEAWVYSNVHQWRPRGHRLLMEGYVEDKDPYDDSNLYVVGLEIYNVDLGNLERRIGQGPWWCVLCKEIPKPIYEIFVDCQYTIFVWIELEGWIIGMREIWNKDTTEYCLKIWFGRRDLKLFKTLPLIKT